MIDLAHDDAPRRSSAQWTRQDRLKSDLRKRHNG
jgi:hypothetical protein